MSAPDLGVDGIHQHVGAYWTRNNSVEVDVVVADRPQPPARKVLAVGSIKWTTSPCDARTLAALTAVAPQVPGFDPATTTLLAVSRNGFRGDLPSSVRTFEPQEIVAALRGPA